MGHDIKRITELSYKAASGIITPEEWDELSAFLHESPENWRRFEERIGKSKVTETLALFQQWDKAKEEGKERMMQIPDVQQKRTLSIWQKALIAASVIIIIGNAVIWKMMRSGKEGLRGPKVLIAQHDILPGTNKAILTLANGSTIVLDSAGNGALARQGNTQVVKVDSGAIAYRAEAATGKAALYNTITTPRGGQYKIILPDGSKVWLNAASALRYPIAFTGAARSVELVSGEAYFEVAHNASQPFTVRVPAVRQGGRDLMVDVLGTSFDLNTYTDESGEKTTLLNGSVKVTRGTSTVLLHPGEQAVADSGREIVTVNSDINAAATVAWKDGYFSFDRVGTEAIMRQLARWYDVQVSYEGTIPVRQFVATIPRNVPVSSVLKALELNNVHFKIEGKKIIVMP